MENTMLLARESIEQIDARIDRAVAAVGGDFQVSVPLAEAVKNFKQVSRHALDQLGAVGPGGVRELIVAVEQAGERAREAAAEDRTATDGTRQAVFDAYGAIQKLEQRSRDFRD